MSIQSAKRKQTLDERAATLKDKNRSRKLPLRLATPEIRRQRLIAIRERMGLSHTNFREMLGMTEQHWKAVFDGERPVVVGLVMLAEIELRRFLWREQRARKAARGHVPVIPDEYVNNADLMGRVITAHLTGKSNDSIAEEFAIRPDIVEFYISRLT